ncbi:hypothetical protein GCM10028822_00220 [Hymenobacter terrigena]
MYTTLPSGQAAVGAAASPVAGLRAALTALTFGNALLSEEEQLRANHSIHECEDVFRLTRWFVNTRRELARRARAREMGADSDRMMAVETQAPSPICYATCEQKTLLLRLLQQPHVTRAQQTRVLVGLNRLTSEKAAVLLQQLALPPWLDDQPACLLDLRVAEVFSPAMSLTYADLVRG